jgi:hypothetical protein
VLVLPAVVVGYQVLGEVIAVQAGRHHSPPLEGALDPEEPPAPRDALEPVNTPVLELDS